MPLLSLEKILHSQGFGSRKLCRIMVFNGRVTIAGALCDDPQREIETDRFQFEVDGQRWQYRQHVYLAMNKPLGVECSHQPQHHPSVYRLLPPQLVERGVQCVGRLDQDTTGVLLFSDDGAFIHAYSAPKKKVPKVYQVTTKHPIQHELIAALLSGVQLRDEPAPIAAAGCAQITENVLHLTIAEGKYHQVKRMIAAAGNRVDGLHRIAVGGYALDPALNPGEFSWLEPGDLEKIGQYA
ncbi:16S rRNA pseudouridine(516) synthase [Undibacterium arcticum]|uniref:Pseudouridine synthase n=1 Tax=Undibacterium arcticum TaxID=1762892 RepID=A0ABV7FA95_9BURK